MHLDDVAQLLEDGVRAGDVGKGDARLALLPRLPLALRKLYGLLWVRGDALARPAVSTAVL